MQEPAGIEAARDLSRFTRGRQDGGGSEAEDGLDEVSGRHSGKFPAARGRETGAGAGLQYSARV